MSNTPLRAVLILCCVHVAVVGNLWGQTFADGPGDGSESASINGFLDGSSTTTRADVFRGGDADGWASSTTSSLLDGSSIAALGLYLGGDQDGYTAAGVTQLVNGQSISVLAPLYAGGNGDGSDMENSISNRIDTLYDQDMDLIGDYWEIRYGLSFSNATDALIDQDGDGEIARDEFIADTDPFDDASILRLVIYIDSNDSRPRMGFTSSSERLYQIQRRTSITQGSWQLNGAEFSGNGSTMERILPSNQAFYVFRLVVRMP